MKPSESSSSVVPASRRRKAIQDHGRRKAHTLRLVVPCKEKRNADGAAARKKARATAGDLVSNGKIPRTFSANLAGETSRYMTQLELQNKGDRTAHKAVWGGVTSTGSSPTSGSQAAEPSLLPFPTTGRGWTQITGYASTSTSAGSP